MRIAGALALLAVIPLTGCTSFEQRVVAVENRQAAIETQITELQQAQMQISAQLARIQSDLDSALDPLRVQQADRGEDVRALQREVTAMEEQIAEIDARIAMLRDEATSGGGGGRTAAMGPAMPPARGQRSVDDGRQAEPQNDAAQTLYNSAYGDYVRSNYELCVQGFEEYLRLYPTSANAPNARYWTGMCLRDQGRREQARAAFQDVVADYPASEIVADAMFMDASILMDMGRTDEATQTLLRLVQAYPTRDPALLACRQLSDLDVELPAACLDQ